MRAAYEEWSGGAELAAEVACLWSRQVGAAPGPVLPDGCTDILWVGGRLTVAGPDTGPAPVGVPSGARIVGIRFRPGVAPAVLGVPASELADARVGLDLLWGTGAESLAERLHAVAGPRRVQRQGDVLAAAVRQRLAEGPPVDPIVRPVLAGLAAEATGAGGGGGTVAALAARLGLSERHLHRRCRAAFGYGAKTLDRVLRLQRFLALARSGRRPPGGLAGLAVAAGYADQAHLGHECRLLAAATPSALVSPDPARSPVAAG